MGSFAPPQGSGNPNSISFFFKGNLYAQNPVASFIAPRNLNIKYCDFAVGTAPVGSDILCDIYVNGSSVFTTAANKPKIAAGTTTFTSARPDLFQVLRGQRVDLVVTQVGATTAGADMLASVVTN